MKNTMSAILVLLLMALSNSAMAEGTVLRLYSDRESGETRYYVIHPSSINYMQWDEDDKVMRIITAETKHGESEFLVPIQSNEDAERFIEILMGKNADRWLNADHK